MCTVCVPCVAACVAACVYRVWLHVCADEHELGLLDSICQAAKVTQWPCAGFCLYICACQANELAAEIGASKEEMGFHDNCVSPQRLLEELMVHYQAQPSQVP